MDDAKARVDTITIFAGLAPMIFDRSIEAQFLIPMAVSMGFGILFTTVTTPFLLSCSQRFAEDAGRAERRWFCCSLAGSQNAANRPTSP
ncbi:MAG: hypothetical protein ACKVYV_13240 [Limisphaerales bacterium]